MTTLQISRHREHPALKATPSTLSFRKSTEEINEKNNRLAKMHAREASDYRKHNLRPSSFMSQDVLDKSIKAKFGLNTKEKPDLEAAYLKARSSSLDTLRIMLNTYKACLEICSSPDEREILENEFNTHTKALVEKIQGVEERLTDLSSPTKSSPVCARSSVHVKDLLPDKSSKKRNMVLSGSRFLWKNALPEHTLKKENEAPLTATVPVIKIAPASKTTPLCPPPLTQSMLAFDKVMAYMQSAKNTEGASHIRPGLEDEVYKARTGSSPGFTTYIIPSIGDKFYEYEGYEDEVYELHSLSSRIPSPSPDFMDFQLTRSGSSLPEPLDVKRKQETDSQKFARLAREEAATLAKTKMCPTCNVVIMLEPGLANKNMTCVCGGRFCWICGCLKMGCQCWEFAMVEADDETARSD
ncbi:hypothetical protein BJ878DRAFT_98059 [Calycina marina]|uniref:Uncharacterized protein n=1 Tax=Calycina marina TaxID=1763456 RepID=A0A9P7Z1J4_9HELO|nr:hypothetical protein BJ878DRAFT_98059 [Calycina marina]